MVCDGPGADPAYAVTEVGAGAKFTVQLAITDPELPLADPDKWTPLPPVRPLDAQQTAPQLWVLPGGGLNCRRFWRAGTCFPARP